MRSEKAILNETLVAVSALPETLVWRNNTGTAWQGERQSFYPGTTIPVPPNVVVLTDARPVTFGLPGSADIIGVVQGRAVAVETKTSRGQQSEQQVNFESAWKRCGGVYVLARTADEAIEGLLIAS